ncbi:MAG: hypothetical protein MI757_22280 [Pirellulales bacterium]|nr:hypothetical protein [Pirellulales bacterium]
MPNSNAIAALSQALSVLESSLPQYLANTRPWTRRGDEKATETLEQIISDQQRDSGRIADMIEATNEPLPSGQYPMSYTDTHDLAMEYLVRELTDYQKQDVAAFEHCVELAGSDTAAKPLLEEVLGSSRAHLEMLEELFSVSAV